MVSFLHDEKPHQTTFKRESGFFSGPAREDGHYRRKDRPFCVPIDHAEENLFPEIRDAAMAFFSAKGIRWHDGQNDKPSNHLCDSQACCVNFLFSFADRPEALAALLRPLFPELRRAVPFEKDTFVTFEWIGEQDYLRENRHEGSRRTRGAHFTSADAVVAFERDDGRKQVVLIEWKYTESYGVAPLKTSRRGTDRMAIYKPLFDRADCPIDKQRLPSFESLFYEPFYQLMRQQFLAKEMERARESEADIVSLLHVAPSGNKDFHRVTSPELKSLGDTATGVWKRLVKTPGRFLSVSTEELFGPLLAEPPAGMRGWADYLTERYRWVTGTAEPS